LYLATNELIQNLCILASEPHMRYIGRVLHHLKKTTDILIIIFAILVVSALTYVIIGILIIQDKYEGEPQTTEFIQKVSIEEIGESQQKGLKWINEKATEIENNTKLTQAEYNLSEFVEIITDGGGILKVWRHDNQIYKIHEEVGLSYGRITNIIYLDNDLPIKIIETEENFGNKNGEIDYNELKEVFRANIYVFDWENDDVEIEQIGKRVLSEGSCSTFDYEPIIKRAKKTTSE